MQIDYRSEKGWNVLFDEPFRIFYTSPDGEVAKRILKSLGTLFPEVSQFIGYRGEKILNVALAISQEDFDNLTGGKVPYWGNGATDYTRMLIVLKSPRFSRTSFEDLEKTLAHELTHLLLGNMVNIISLPRWFNEGLSIYMAGEHSFRSDLILSKAIFNKSILPLDNIANVLTFERVKADLAYAQSGSAVQYLIETYGKNVVSTLLYNV
ncbi:MAG: peptidase MA family metallohydrolase, partial [Fidelibacterota bacterium]